MPRVPRTRSNSRVYHIVMRGINRQTLFEAEEDYTKFIGTLLKYKKVCEYKLFAYCLMGNHLHLLLMEGKEPLEKVMRRICCSYVLWYNRKYDRIGYLFQDRYKSEPVENEAYFRNVLRYIYKNPVKAGLVSDIAKYEWSNYRDYINGKEMEDTDFVLNIFSANRENAVRSFVELVNEESEDNCLDISEKRFITDNNARDIIKSICKVNNPPDLQKLDIKQRNTYLKNLKEQCGLSIRQIERLTGINRGIVQKT